MIPCPQPSHFSPESTPACAAQKAFPPSLKNLPSSTLLHTQHAKQSGWKALPRATTTGPSIGAMHSEHGIGEGTQALW